MKNKKSVQRRQAKRLAIKAAAASQDIIFASSDSSLEVIEAADKIPAVSLIAYNGGKLRLPNFQHPVIIDTAGVKAMNAEQLPILRDHDQKRPLGHGKPIIEATGLKHEGPLSHEGKERDDVIKAQHNGFKWQSSVGGSIPNVRRDVQIVPMGNKVSVNGRSHDGPVVVVRAFLWKETSVCALGADEDRASASVAAAHNQKRYVLMNEFEKWLAAAGIVAANHTDEQIANLKASFEAMQRSTGGDDGDDDGDDDAGETKTGKKKVKASSRNRLTLDEVRASVREEARFVNQVESLFASYSNALKPEDAQKLKDKVLSGEVSRDAAHVQLLQAQRGSVQASGSAMTDHPSIAMVLEASIARAAGLDDETIAASFTEASPEVVDRVMHESQSARYRNVGIRGLIRAACRQAGHSSYDGEIGNAEIEAALMHAQTVRVHAASGGSSFSTVSVPGILGGVARRSMLAAYAETDMSGVITRIASITSSSDFKKFERYRMTESGTMELVPATGEVKHGQVTEEGYENKVDTYGKLIALSRQMMINDDLAAFLQIPRMLGRQGRHSLEEIGITKLVNAPTTAGAGTTEFFHGADRGTQRANYIEGAGTVLSMDSLEDAYQLFLEQKDAGGKPIMMTPSVLLTGAKNALLARRLYNEAEYRYADGTGKQFITNPWKGMFRPEVSAYLGVLGTTANPDQWYLLAEATEDVGVLQLAFLNGNRNPVIEQGEMNLNVLGVTYRGIFDFGFALQDPRAGVKSKGKA